MSGYVRIGQVISGEVKLLKVMSGYDRLGQVMSCQNMLR